MSLVLGWSRSTSGRDGVGDGDRDRRNLRDLRMLHVKEFERHDECHVDMVDATH